MKRLILIVFLIVPFALSAQEATELLRKDYTRIDSCLSDTNDMRHLDSLACDSSRLFEMNLDSFLVRNYCCATKQLKKDITDDGLDIVRYIEFLIAKQTLDLLAHENCSQTFINPVINQYFVFDTIGNICENINFSTTDVNVSLSKNDTTISIDPLIWKGFQKLSPHFTFELYDDITYSVTAKYKKLYNIKRFPLQKLFMRVFSRKSFSTEDSLISDLSKDTANLSFTEKLNYFVEADTIWSDSIKFKNVQKWKVNHNVQIVADLYSIKLDRDTLFVTLNPPKVSISKQSWYSPDYYYNKNQDYNEISYAVHLLYQGEGSKKLVMIKNRGGAIIYYRKNDFEIRSQIRRQVTEQLKNDTLEVQVLFTDE